MIAIPVKSEDKSAACITGLYGNAKYFALADGAGNFEIVKNEGQGNGIATAEFLVGKGVDATAYIHLGDGPFGALNKNGVKVYCVGKEEIAVADVVAGIASGKFPLVTPENADTMLDPGNPSGECACGCTHG